MKKRYTSYKLLDDTLQQAAKQVAACSRLVFEKQQEFLKAKADLEDANVKLIILLGQSPDKRVVVDRVEYSLTFDKKIKKELKL